MNILIVCICACVGARHVDSQIRADLKRLSIRLHNSDFRVHHGHCYHHHGRERHQVPYYKCTIVYTRNTQRGHTCESLPHDRFGCPLEPIDYDKCGLIKCAPMQPEGGKSWRGKTGCDCRTRRMNDDDIDLWVNIVTNWLKLDQSSSYNEMGPTVTGISGSALGKTFGSKQHFCHAQCRQQISFLSMFRVNINEH